MSAQRSKKRSAIQNPRMFFRERFLATKARFKGFLKRRPHRSFRMTKRRDMPTYAALPGYWSFIGSVIETIRTFIKPFSIFFVMYVILLTLFVGIVQQEQYRSLTEAFQNLGTDIIGGDIDQTTQTVALFGAAITGGLSEPLTETQQLYVILLGLFSWLVLIWYLRHRLAGTNVKVRDAIYNAGSPFITTIIIGLVIGIQLLPAAIGILIYTTADAAGILQGGVESMMFAAAAILLSVLSLYWATSSVFSLLLVTIPGTYPFAALRMGGDLVVGRRLQIMLRLLWLGLLLLLVWAAILIPMILLSGWDSIAWLPLVPITIQMLSAISVITGTTYVYLLYRRMIDEPA